MILVYVNKLTSRIRYTFKVVFKTYLGITEYKLTADKKEFKKFVGNKFSYSAEILDDELHFKCTELLFENGIKETKLEVINHEDVPTIFTTLKGSALPYDPFASTFYFLTRYEEYLPHVRDQYDRFTAKDSLASRNKFLQRPVVDLWMKQLGSILTHHFSNVSLEKRKFTYLPTIDIDNAFAFKYKGIFRTLASLFKNFFTLEWNKMGKQIKVLLGKMKDPFDTYNYQLNIQKKFNIKSLYFILIGDYGLNDKNLSAENRNFKGLIKSISDYSDLGIHPSYGSNKKPEKLKVEIKRLEDIVKTEIKKSRQHFLKLSLPETYRNLLEVDLEEDYTMGFAAELGFRAGTCTPYPFYDLDEEVECKLMVYPFQVMESTLKYYLNYSAQNSIDAIKAIIDEIKAVNGTFISLWHNESLSEQDEWEGWRRVYEEMIEYATESSEK